MNAQTRAPDWLLLSALLSLTGVSILSTDLYTPSLPHLPVIFGTTASTVQLTMSLNLAALAVCELCCGPLADRFGRKALLAFGLVGFFAATVACAAAPSIEVLIAARIAQGAFASVEAVVTVLVLSELFTGEDGTRAMGLYGMGLGAFPAMGPLIGGYVHIAAGWRANFVLMAIAIAIVGILAMRVLPETKQGPPKPVRFGPVLKGYRSLLGDRAVLRYLLPMAAVMAGLFAFITAMPFILIDHLGVPTEGYGYYFFVIVGFYISGSFAVNRLALRVGAEALVRTGVAIFLVGALSVFSAVNWFETIWSLVLTTSVTTFGLGLLFGAAPLLLLDAAGEGRRGLASGLMGSVQIGAAAMGAFAVGEMHDGTAMPFAAVMLVSGAIGAVSYWGLRDGKPRT